MKKQEEIAIRLTRVCKKYEIHHEKPTLVEKFVRGKHETYWALKNISVTIKKGERVGLIGSNGSGKTTLLKIIAGITTPTEGSVETHGRIVSLIDLEAGFHPDLSGFQNIYLNGMLLGLTKREIEDKIHDIIAFADIRQFIDAPLFTYSSGMALRLGFAIAVHADPDILLLDENISAGDTNFQKKSYRKIQEFFRKKITIVMCSHQIGIIAKACTHIVLIENSRIKLEGGLKTLSVYDSSWQEQH